MCLLRLRYNIRVKTSIFIVEDDPDISRLLRHHLEAEGTPSGCSLREIMSFPRRKRQRPSLFILDIMVPGKDGLELCRQIRKNEPLASIPVIFLTAKKRRSRPHSGFGTRSGRLHRQAF